MKTLNCILCLILVILAVSCSKDQILNAPEQVSAENELKSASTQMKIAVISDIHYLDPSLMTNNAAAGTAFQNYLDASPNLLEFVDPIFKKTMSQIIASKPDILLIPGDLTKDGEKASHKALAKLFQQISDNRIKVYVIPGNHDIKNPEAKAYNGNYSSPTPNISAADFVSIYSNFGYKYAISRDPHSLSYVCQPFKNIWILAIDDCKYYQNTPGGTATVSGVIKKETMKWIQNRLALARILNIKVLAMMHHGIVEHFAGQETNSPGFVTDDWESNADDLIDAGLQVMFTGHAHANDITMRAKGNNVLFDIETGSLVTPPSPYRNITKNLNFLNIASERINSIQASLPLGLDFVTYSKMFMSGHLDGIFTKALVSPPYNVPPVLAVGIAPSMRNALMAHYSGDEHITPLERTKVDWVKHLYPQFGTVLQSLWTDLPPSDNAFIIEMK
jgi:predicted phosphodiesterase